MNEFLQIIGSVASIGSIPLAIYLYLRSREAKFSKLRQDIVRILSYQIGEGRNLSAFEVKAVIDSKVREANGKPGNIEPYEIIEDLVSETISSPLLDSNSKNEILINLRENHRKGALFKAIEDKSISWPHILKYVSEHDGERFDADKITEVSITESAIKKHKTELEKFTSLSDIFGTVAGVTTIIAMTISLSGGEAFVERFSTFFKENQKSFEFIIGILAALVASVITAIMAKYKRNKKD